jgi:predicted P-loop ATPase
VKNQEYGWFMSPTERQQMEPLQERYKTIDPIEEILERYLEPAGDGEFMSCTEILQQCSFGTPGRQHTNIASKYLKKKGYERQSDTKKWKVKFRSIVEEKVLNFDKFKKKGLGLA